MIMKRKNPGAGTVSFSQQLCSPGKLCTISIGKVSHISNLYLFSDATCYWSWQQLFSQHDIALNSHTASIGICLGDCTPTKTANCPLLLVKMA